ncbi:MAG: hypothetical protein AAGA81_21900 [Acidobacteriota bacterium]
MAEKKGIHWLVWVGGGCALLMILAVVSFVGLGVFAAKKVSDVATEIADNPVQTFAKAYALANPEIEFVTADEEGQTVTLRNIETGEEATFDFSELKEGRIQFTGNDGSKVSIGTSEEGVTIDAGDEQIRIGESAGGVSIDSSAGSAQFGGSDSDVPGWVPRPDGVDFEVAFSASSADAETGAYTMKGESIDALATQWKDLLVSSGYTIETELNQGGSQPMRMIVGKDAAQGRQVSVAITSQSGSPQAMVSYASGLR